MENTDEKSRVKAQFSLNAEKFVHSEVHAKGADLPLLVEWVEPRPTDLVLDVATGGGHTAKALSPHVAAVIATDLTPRMLAAARAHLEQSGCSNVSYVIADAEALPFLDASFDIVTCRIAAHHFPNPRRFVAEVGRVLKPNGRFLFIDNIVPDDPDVATYINTFERLRDDSHVRCLSIAEWTQLLAEVGLRVVRAQTQRKRHDFSEWVHRTARDEGQAARVERYIAAGSERARQVCRVEMAAGRVLAWQGEHWVALCQRA
jgi:ubiquinone/menaquinone biosynthesis C-methylase UbiE